MKEDHQELTRVRSLMKEKDDNNQFRHHRNRLIGHTVSNEFHQTIPFFFTREMCQLNMVGNYRGASAFMICNGPSLASGRYDLSLLKKPGVITYGMNNGARTVRPNFWTCVDDPKRFLKSIWLDPTITKFVPHAHAEKPLFDNETWNKLTVEENGKRKDVLVGQCPNVVYFHRNSKFMANRFLWEDTINWGNHKDYGGGRSVMLPVLRILFLLGFRKVYLLGADFKMSDDYTYHFDEQRSKGAVKGNMSTYNRLENEYFPSLKPHFDQAGFEVYNCTEGSQLTTFPFVKYEDAIEEATSKLGDINSRTWGLYGKPEERAKHKMEPIKESKIHLKNISEDIAMSPKYTQKVQLQEIPLKKEVSKTDIVNRDSKKTVMPKFQKISEIMEEDDNLRITDDDLIPVNNSNNHNVSNKSVVKSVPMMSSKSSLNSKPLVYSGPTGQKIPIRPTEPTRQITENIQLSSARNIPNITIEDNGK